MKQTDIEKLINAMKSVFPTKDEMSQQFADVETKVHKLDAKQDNMDIKLDAFLGQILDAREAQEIQQATITEHSDELEKHEQRIKVVEHRLKSSPTPVSSLT